MLDHIQRGFFSASACQSISFYNALKWSEHDIFLFEDRSIPDELYGPLTEGTQHIRLQDGTNAYLAVRDFDRLHSLLDARNARVTSFGLVNSLSSLNFVQGARVSFISVGGHAGVNVLLANGAALAQLIPGILAKELIRAASNPLLSPYLLRAGGRAISHNGRLIALLTGETPAERYHRERFTITTTLASGLDGLMKEAIWRVDGRFDVLGRRYTDVTYSPLEAAAKWLASGEWSANLQYDIPPTWGGAAPPEADADRFGTVSEWKPTTGDHLKRVYQDWKAQKLGRQVGTEVAHAAGHAWEGLSSSAKTAWEATGITADAATTEAARQRISDGVADVAQGLHTLTGPSEEDKHMAYMANLAGEPEPWAKVEEKSAALREGWQAVGENIQTAADEAYDRGGPVAVGAMVAATAGIEAVGGKGAGLALKAASKVGDIVRLAKTPTDAVRALQKERALAQAAGASPEELAVFDKALAESRTAAIAGKQAVIPPDLQDHMSKVVRFDQKSGITGAHNAEVFEAELKARGGRITKTIQGPDGITHYEYEIPALDRTGKPLDPVRYKPPFDKTVYDPKVFSDDKMHELATDAAKKGHAEGYGRWLDNPDSNQYTASSGGVDFRVYLDDKTGEITNIHPKL